MSEPTNHPYTPDYLLRLAAHLETLGPGDCHSEVYPRRCAMAATLRQVAHAPLTALRRAALNTLRFSVYKPMPS